MTIKLVGRSQRLSDGKPNKRIYKAQVTTKRKSGSFRKSCAKYVRKNFGEKLTDIV